MYSYPALRLVQTLSGELREPAALCVDDTTGNIWVVAAGNNKLFEYAHGGATPIKIIKVASYGTALSGCAIDATNGDVAVAIRGIAEDPGGVLVLKSGVRKPQLYFDRTQRLYAYFLAYDPKGNLFVDGIAHRPFVYDELPANTKTFTNINLEGAKVRAPGGVQYHAGNIAIADHKRGIIYRTSGATVTGSTTLKGSCNIEQFLVRGDKAVVASNCAGSSRILVYNYPAGGSAIGQISGLSGTFGVAISY
ncbi:MAG TPA: hypothetical protein VGF98_02995 [Candidatus Tumulicola sp.]